MDEIVIGNNATTLCEVFLMSAYESIKVVVRCRPLSDKEVREGRTSGVIQIDHSTSSLVLRSPVNRGRCMSRQFTFDKIFSPVHSQEEIFSHSVAPIVDTVLAGYNGTVFCYGQTGAGKSYTMQGGGGDQRGVVPRVCEYLMDRVTEMDQIYLSFAELYNEEVRDLLMMPCSYSAPNVASFSSSSILLKNVSVERVTSLPGILSLIERGNKQRRTCSTNMNEESSRSHSILTIRVRRSGDDKKFYFAKLHLVDLAGSERLSKSGSTGVALKEAVKINLSLSALGNVIAALTCGDTGSVTTGLDDNAAYIPYRDSKLTRLLQDSLGGNSRTVMIANVGPADYNFDETLATLRYANRAKNIRNKPILNLEKVEHESKDRNDVQDRRELDVGPAVEEYETVIAELKDEIHRLNQELEKLNIKNCKPANTSPNYLYLERELLDRIASARDREAELVDAKRRLEESQLLDNTISVHELETQNNILRAQLESVTERYHGMALTLRDLEKVNKLNETILAMCVGEEQLKQIEARIKWDEALQEWLIPEGVTGTYKSEIFFSRPGARTATVGRPDSARSVRMTTGDKHRLPPSAKASNYLW